MSQSSDLIERLEQETGQRIDDNDGDNFAMAGLIGAMARMMNQSPSCYTERDDVSTGMLIRNSLSPEYQRKKSAQALMAELLIAGVSPDDIQSLTGR